MQTGTEDYDAYIARGRGDDRQRVIDLMDERFAEAPGSPDDQIRAGALRRGIYDFPMVWSCHIIAQFLGGRFDGKRDQYTENKSTSYREGPGQLQRGETAGDESAGTHADVGGVDGGDADPF